MAIANRCSEPKAIGEAAQLPLECLMANGQNRRTTNDEELKGLAASIAAVGLLYPLIVRAEPRQPGRYRIFAGERRWRALKLLKAESAPCLIVRGEVADAEVLRVVENHQRKNLTPLEEALAIHTLLEAGLEAEAVARCLGRSRAWLARRSSLTALSVAWLGELQDEASKIAQWPASHLELIARFPTEVQDAMLERYGHLWRNAVPNFKDLQGATGQHLRLLSQSPWKLDDETLNPVAGSCLACPKRSSCVPDLFPDELAESAKPQATDFCLDPACWRIKAEAFLQRRLQTARAEHPNLLLLNASEHGNRQALEELFDQPVCNVWEVALAKKSTPQALPALVVNGPGLGRIKWVVPVGHNGAHHNGRSHAAEEENAPPVERTLEERREAYDKRRRQFVIDLVKAKIDTLAAEPDYHQAPQHEGGAALAENGLAAKTIFLLACLSENQTTGETCGPVARVPWDELHALRNHELGANSLREALLTLCWELLCEALHCGAQLLQLAPGEKDNQRPYAFAATAVGWLGLDWPALRGQAAQAIPYAKAWREQVEDEWAENGHAALPPEASHSMSS